MWSVGNGSSVNVAILTSKSVLFEASMNSLQVQVISSTCCYVKIYSIRILFSLFLLELLNDIIDFGSWAWLSVTTVWSGRLIHACACEILDCWVSLFYKVMTAIALSPKTYWRVCGIMLYSVSAEW